MNAVPRAIAIFNLLTKYFVNVYALPPGLFYTHLCGMSSENTKKLIRRTAHLARNCTIERFLNNLRSFLFPLRRSSVTLNWENHTQVQILEAWLWQSERKSTILQPNPARQPPFYVLNMRICKMKHDHARGSEKTKGTDISCNKCVRK